MRRRNHSYLTILLVLAVTLTAQSAGALRGMRDAVGQIVICSGNGPLVLYVDSDGQPAKTPYDCPDCVALAIDSLEPPTLPQLAAQKSLRSTDQSADIWVHSRMPRQASARSPPFGV